MDIDTLTRPYIECTHIFRLYIIPTSSWSQAHDKCRWLLWPEQLCTVRMVITHPQEDRLPVSIAVAVACGFFKQCSETVQVHVVASSYSQVLSVVVISLPTTREIAFSCPRLVALSHHKSQHRRTTSHSTVSGSRGLQPCCGHLLISKLPRSTVKSSAACTSRPSPLSASSVASTSALPPLSSHAVARDRSNWQT